MLTGLGRPRKDSEHSLGSFAADNRAWGSRMQEAKPRLQRSNSIRRVQWKCCVLDALLGLAALCCLGIAQGKKLLLARITYLGRLRYARCQTQRNVKWACSRSSNRCLSAAREV